ncbi:MAG: Ni/Fe-hydrogenase, b-type cytochrome subunit [Planctomycetes bacterium]|nr:Ni/Fe-hydrogenase, b-type cytochrome subunit [Planctomycetota bacterium]
MSSTHVAIPEAPSYQRVYVWQWPIRVFHWITAASIVVLFTSGWLIGNPTLVSNGEAWEHFVMGRVREVHLVAAMVFTLAFAWRSAWFFLGNRHARSGFPYFWKPSWWRNLVTQGLDYLKLEAGTPHLGHNALAGLSYTLFIIGLGLVQIFTGFALLGQAQPGGLSDRLFGWVLPLLGGAMRATAWHHLAAWGFVVFVVLHVYIIFIDARQYRNGLIVSIITGYKFKRRRAAGETSKANDD